MNKIPKEFPTKIADRALAASDGHFIPIIQLEMEFHYSLDEQRLAKAVALTMDAEPILGCRFAPQMIKPYWERVEKERFDVFTLTNNKNEYEAFKNKAIDLFSEPQFFTCLFRSESTDRLILKISHLVTDAAGVKDIATILSTIYNRLACEPNYRPIPNLNDFRSFWHILKHVPWYVYPRIFFNFLHELLTSTIPYKSHSVPIKNTSKNVSKYITRHIDKEKITNMIKYAKENNATINDVLLTAIFYAFSKIGEWDAKAALRIGITIDLRRYMPNRKAESISNFSAIEIVTYGAIIENDFESTLTRVIEMINKRKSSWLGLSQFVSTNMSIWPLPFPILKILTKKGWESRYNTPNSSDLFTNMGEILIENVNFGGNPTRAWLLPPGCDLPILFFGCSSYDGTLSLSASIVPDAMNEAFTDTFFDLIISELPLSSE